MYVLETRAHYFCRAIDDRSEYERMSFFVLNCFPKSWKDVSEVEIAVVAAY